MRKLLFYSVLTGLVILNSFLLANPNILGKIGLILYNYHYLRNFPRTLITVSLVVGISVALAELINFLVKNHVVNRKTGIIILSALTLVAFAVLVNTAIAFSKWAYSHTGLRFELGAFVLPTLLICVFVHTLLMLPTEPEAFPESPAAKEQMHPQNPTE
jgi:hypothetical protein